GHEVRGYWKVDCSCDARDVSQASIAANYKIVPRVGKPLRKREPGAGRREGGESQVPKVARGTHVPRVRNDETSPLVERTKGFAPVGERGLRCRVMLDRSE